MTERLIRSQRLTVGQTRDGEWQCRYFGIAAHASTRTKALHRMATVLNEIDAFAAKSLARAAESESEVPS